METVKPEELYSDLIDIELSLLVGLMFNRYNWSEFPEVEVLTGEDFIWDRHRWIWETILALHRTGHSPNFYTVGLYLHKAAPAQYKAMKGDHYFRESCMAYGELAMSVPHIRQWARDIKEASIERQEKVRKQEFKFGKGGWDVPTFD